MLYAGSIFVHNQKKIKCCKKKSTKTLNKFKENI